MAIHRSWCAVYQDPDVPPRCADPAGPAADPLPPCGDAATPGAPPASPNAGTGAPGTSLPPSRAGQRQRGGREAKGFPAEQERQMSTTAEYRTGWPSRRHPRAYFRALRAAGKWTHTDGGKVRWRLWSLAIRSRRVCPASAHSLIIWGYLRDPCVDDMCRRDCADNGTCWCGKLRAERLKQAG